MKWYSPDLEVWQEDGGKSQSWPQMPCPAPHEEQRSQDEIHFCPHGLAL